MTQIGELLDSSTAALVIVAESKLEQALDTAIRHATKQYEKEVRADAREFNKDFEAAVDHLIKSDVAESALPQPGHSYKD